MKKVLMLHGENTYNYGTFMMLINYIYYTNKYSKVTNEYHVCLNSDEDYLRLKKELPSDIKIIRFEYEKENKASNIFKKIVGLKYKYFDQIRQIKKEKFNKVVVLGGDDLSEYYKKWLVITDLLILIKLSKIVKLELIGQTVGPFYSWRKKIAKKLFNNSRLVLRDKLCADYLEKELFFNNFKVLNDLAFLKLPFEEKRLNILNKYTLSNLKYISIIPSGLYKHYSGSWENYIKNWINITKTLLETKELNDCVFVFFGHVLKPLKCDDRLVIKEIEKIIDSSRCKFILDDMLASEARTILKNGYFNITGRMHPAISTLSSNKLALSLSYSVKYKGIIGGQIGLPELVIEREDNWDNFKINEKINKKILSLVVNDRIKNFNINSKLEKIKEDIIKYLFKNL